MHSLLGEEAELRYTGLIVSYPGSTDQPWHGDGPHLFGEQTGTLPAHAINVFIPLHDITEELGPTELIAGSHKLLENGRVTVPPNTRERTIAPLLRKGSVLLYDFRVIHRGTSNKSTGRKIRYMLYLLFAKPWFQDHINFGDISVFDENIREMSDYRKAGEDPNCPGFYFHH